MSDPGLTQAISIVGGKAALARALGISREAVSQWDRVPVNRVWDVIKATGDKLQPRDLRPDVFKAPPGDA